MPQCRPQTRTPAWVRSLKKQEEQPAQSRIRGRRARPLRPSRREDRSPLGQVVRRYLRGIAGPVCVQQRADRTRKHADTDTFPRGGRRIVTNGNTARVVATGTVCWGDTLRMEVHRRSQEVPGMVASSTGPEKAAPRNTYGTAGASLPLNVLTPRQNPRVRVTQPRMCSANTPWCVRQLVPKLPCLGPRHVAPEQRRTPKSLRDNYLARDGIAIQRAEHRQLGHTNGDTSAPECGDGTPADPSGRAFPSDGGRVARATGGQRPCSDGCFRGSPGHDVDSGPRARCRGLRGF